MSSSRPESRRTSGRRRSNTVNSGRRAPTLPPVIVGDRKTLTVRVHETKEAPGVIFHRAAWPGISVGDLIRATIPEAEEEDGWLFCVSEDDDVSRHAPQFSVPRPLAERFNLTNNGELTITKVEKSAFHVDYVELIFQDQYLGRNDMWRLAEHLEGQCVFVNQEITFIGAITAKVIGIFIGGNRVPAGLVVPSTKTTYRSLSAKVTIYIQVCRELWEFAGDGERFNEKIVHAFLPALLAHWREAGTNHVVTIVLISRVYYDQSEIAYAAGPLRRDDDLKWYKDFYKVITDLELVTDWRATLVSLKDSFWAFQRDILLTHHYHQAAVDSGHGPPEQARLVGQLSFAHDGPILEALNLGLNPTETHYIDRSLSLTGTSTIIITPGTGYYRVNKHLLRLTTTRLLDQGFGIDLVSLAKPPLHQTPIFAFKGAKPELRLDSQWRGDSRATDPLWSGDDKTEGRAAERTLFWWEPFWMAVSFWDKQMDLPFRQDRFVARAKMHQVQMLGLLDHDVLSSIQIPFLHDRPNSLGVLPDPRAPITQLDAERYDLDTFILKKDERPASPSRGSYASSGSGTIAASSWASDNRSTYVGSKRSSVIGTTPSTNIHPIEESPNLPDLSLPTEMMERRPIRPTIKPVEPTDSDSAAPTSPSKASIRSVDTSRSTSTVATSGPSSAARNYLKPSWLFKPFRNTPIQPEPDRVTVPASTTTVSPVSISPAQRKGRDISGRSSLTAHGPQPVAIKHSPTNRPPHHRGWEEEYIASRIRHSPVNTPPRDEATFGKRRSTVLSFPPLGSSPLSPTNPLKARGGVAPTNAALARRWQHITPQPLFKHEIKWSSMATPGCLPLTVEHFPGTAELESSYGVFTYDIVVDPAEISSFMVRAPPPGAPVEDTRRACALVVMRGMAAVRLAQGFQFVVKPETLADQARGERPSLRRAASYIEDDEFAPRPTGPSDVLKTTDSVYLSMSNEIHRISYKGEAIQVRRYVRRVPPAPPIDYQCLIWPKLGVGYTELKTSFVSHGLENYGWNRLDMLVAGYEHQFNESLRYWRTRFVVVPAEIPSTANIGPSGEKLNEEEIRLMGMDRLSEAFTRVRWQPPDARGTPPPPVRFVLTDMDPAVCVLNEDLTTALDQLHAAGPLRKKIQERYLADMSLAAVARAMREEDGVNIKDWKWHGRRYPESFTGSDLVSWMVREFRDVSTRDQGTEWGAKLLERGLFDHSRGVHGFLDGHYYYQLKGEFAVSVTPRTGWFRTAKQPSNEEEDNHATASPHRARKRLILSQSMVIDVDPGKRSDQAESVILHHDIVHNPGTAFHFEIHWIGTTARCIDDLIHRQWSRTIERYGLRLVEAYVTPIGAIRERNAFQSCFPVRLALAPPAVRTVPEGASADEFLACALLRRLGFVLDIQAAHAYPVSVDVVYSYRRAPFAHTQFVHRSGVAFAQVRGGAAGFLFLTNRLMVRGRGGAQDPAEAAEEIRLELQAFCSSEERLRAFYDAELAALGDTAPDEPPPLSI